jgi:hypothetical protein
MDAMVKDAIVSDEGHDVCRASQWRPARRDSRQDPKSEERKSVKSPRHRLDEKTSD